MIVVAVVILYFVFFFFLGGEITYLFDLFKRTDGMIEACWLILATSPSGAACLLYIKTTKGPVW